MDTQTIDIGVGTGGTGGRHEARFRMALARLFHISDADPRLALDQKFAAIGDSLDYVEAVMEIEDEFSIQIDDEAADVAQTVGTVGALFELVKARVPT